MFFTLNIFSSGVYVSDDGKYLWLIIVRGTESVNGLWYAELQSMLETNMSLPPKWCKLFNNFDASYGVSLL